MRHKHLRFGSGFQVVLGDEHSQAAQMTIEPGCAEGGPDNRHRGADQWLYVVSGRGIAIVAGERIELRAGTLVLIESRRDARDPQYRPHSPPHRSTSTFRPPTPRPETNGPRVGRDHGFTARVAMVVGRYRSQRVIPHAVLEEAGQYKAGLELTADLVLQRVPEAERFVLLGVSPPFFIRQARPVRVRDCVPDHELAAIGRGRIVEDDRVPD